MKAETENKVTLALLNKNREETDIIHTYYIERQKSSFHICDDGRFSPLDISRYWTWILRISKKWDGGEVLHRYLPMFLCSTYI